MSRIPGHPSGPYHVPQQSDRATARVLADGNGSYAAYIKDGTHATLSLILPPGTYRGTWVDTVTGENVRQDHVECRGFTCGFESPEYETDIALRIDRIGS